MTYDSSKMLGGLWGALTGDALGVPVEFQSRANCARNPVTDMRGYGTHHQPPGTWSDDSALMLCTIASLNECGKFDAHDLAKRFIAWLDTGYMTPHGDVFDAGNATRAAIARLRRGVEPALAGGDTPDSNGNGSLMRILPIALYFADAPAPELLQAAHTASALTHRHARSQMSCGICCLIAVELLKGQTPAAAYANAIATAQNYYAAQPAFAPELAHFARVLSGQIASARESEISSSGYVLATLEASIWCLLNTADYAQAVLRAVNLGDDTDTTGIVTGGLAGLSYGLDAVPQHWRDALARRAEIADLLQTFILNSRGV